MTETAAANPELLADQVASLLVQPLEAASVVLASGPQIFDTAGVMRVPKLVSGSTPTFVGEGGLIPDTADVDFDELTLMPTERKSIKTILKYTNELVRQSVIGIDAVMKARLVKDVSDALDTALLTGDGADDSITGIINQDDVQTDIWDPTDPDTLMDAIGLAVAAEVMPNRWFINGADFVKLRKVKETTGSKKYVLESDLTKDATYRLLGIPVTVTNKLEEGTAILADVSQVAIARDIAPSVKVLTERYAEYDQIGLRVVTRYDLGLLHPEGVIVLGLEQGS
ncbi:phage major capsid protein [Mycolicibacterium sp. OfavD-34-C]|uniref:phage major capsid protein n=1 Tax=Mycolicibacterium sp. OfavD-34-C TaxID=2917746 RepID=UPI001EF48D00|nr:phage major capsid protein [Mycolicibacterium sp. OfavD-34-C]MCG7582787.1 phage major capsid protein [Mycolicibacterium sp. OfavD-34-C]